MSLRKTRSYSTEFRLQVVKSYLDGEGTLKALARRYGINHTLILYWLDKHRRGELTEEDRFEEKARDAEQKVAALERKVGQLTMELDILKKLTRQPAALSSATPSLICGPAATALPKDAES